MRSVQVIDESAGTTTRAEHVIGVDESGNVTGPGLYALAAVRCPREDGEHLAELLVQNGLSPWQAKSQTLTENITPKQRGQRVEGLLEDLDTASIPWRVAVGYDQETIHHKAAAVCILAKKTITEAESYRGDAVLLPDGAASMYGRAQEHLRTQAAQIIGPSFQSAFGSVYVTGFPSADLTYPEVAAADYIAGHIRSQMDAGEHPTERYDSVVWFNRDWRDATSSPLPFYQIKGLTGSYGGIVQTRVAAWIKGRYTSGESHDVSSQWENTVRMLESRTLQEYLLKGLGP